MMKIQKRTGAFFGALLLLGNGIVFAQGAAAADAPQTEPAVMLEGFPDALEKTTVLTVKETNRYSFRLPYGWYDEWAVNPNAAVDYLESQETSAVSSASVIDQYVNTVGMGFVRITAEDAGTLSTQALAGFEDTLRTQAQAGGAQLIDAGFCEYGPTCY